MTTRYDALIRQSAQRYGVPYAGFRAQLVKESGLNPRALSPAGARGIAQFMPGTAQGLGIDPYDPQQAIPAAAKHMATLYKNLGTWEKALAGYNAGAGAVQKYGGVPPYAETQDYVKSLGKLFAQAQSEAAGPGAVDPPPVKPSVPTPTPENNRALQTLQAIRQMRQGDRTGGIRSMIEATRNIGQGVSEAGDALRGAAATAGVQGLGAALTDAAQNISGQYAALLPGDVSGGSYGYADPEGQGGKHLAIDWFGKHGTPASAITSGTVARITPNPGGNSGQVYGGTLGIRDDEGRLWVMRHIDPLGFKVGQRIQAGQRIGTPSPWQGAEHIHLETYRPGSRDREYRPAYALNPYEVLKGLGVV